MHLQPRVTRVARVALTLILVLGCGLSASAQAPEDDAVLKPAEPEFTLIGLPTSLQLPPLKSEFRLTHRFIRPLVCDYCPDNIFEDLFGMDNGAYIGLEYRMGIVRNLQVGVHRARGDKTIDLFGQYALTRQQKGMPVETALRVSVEGTNNFRDEYSPTVAFIATRLVGEHAAVYIEPVWVGNTNFEEGADENSTFMIGVGTRIRLLSTVYFVGEIEPRVTGYAPGTTAASVGVEKRVGAHMFQLNFSNSFATTLGQLARGAGDSNDWFLGFNLSRKFF
jgi:hypothetical protein